MVSNSAREVILPNVKGSSPQEAMLMPPEQNTLLIAYYYAPANTSGVQRATRFAKYLPQHGCPTHVLASDYGGTDTSLSERVTYVPSTTSREPFTVVLQGLQRIAPYNDQLPWIADAFRAACGLIRKKGITAIVTTSPPVASHLVGLLLKWRWPNLTWIADFRDPLSGNPNRTRTLGIPYDVLLESAVMRAADSVLGVTDVMVEQWKGRYPSLSSKFHLLWNGFDPEDLPKPLPLPPRGYKVLSHLGLLYRFRHPYALLSAVRHLLASGEIAPHHYRISLMGPIEEVERLRNNDDVQYLLHSKCLELANTLLPRADARREVCTSDYGMLLDAVDTNGCGYAVPAKLYDMILVGRPILATTSHGSPVDRMLAKSGLRHCCIYHTDVLSVATAKLLSFLQSPTDPVQPSSWFRDTFDGKKQAALLADLLKSTS